jgi:folylpolyglutamate synthase/dihydropteroate synthase
MPDAQVRRPQILAQLIKEQGYAPTPERTIVVTGSKGKGTTARMVAWHLQQAGFTVGLVVSPEERHHLDRLRINNRPISADVFAQHVTALRKSWSETQQLAAQQGHQFYYHSPSDLFIHVGLAWFASERVEFVVVEGGRGAKYDLIGHLPAALGVVTSVFLEHAAFLGGTESAIAADKFSLFESCQTVIAPLAYKKLLALPAAARIDWLDTDFAVTSQAAGTKGQAVNLEPRWLEQARQLAAAAVRHFSVPVKQRWPSPSFSRIGNLLLDGAISPAALDDAVLSTLATRRVAVVLGLTRDKTVLAVSAALEQQGLARQWQVRLWVGQTDLSEPTLQVNTLCDVDLQTTHSASLKQALGKLAGEYDIVYCVGVQLFLRQVRVALGQDQLVGPNNPIAPVK